MPSSGRSSNRAPGSAPLTSSNPRRASHRRDGRARSRKVKVEVDSGVRLYPAQRQRRGRAARPAPCRRVGAPPGVKRVATKRDAQGAPVGLDKPVEDGTRAGSKT